jgi:putative Mn2+ efflux pump MntP
MNLEIASIQAAIKIFVFLGQERLATELQNQVHKIQELKNQKDYSEPFKKFTTSYRHSIDNLADYLKIENTSVTLDQVLAKTDATGSFITGLRQQDPTFSALFLLAIRAGFVQENKLLTGERQIQVASSYNPDWIGIGMQVKDAPISAGTLGYAIRWHGTSPALLWEAKTSSKVIINAEVIDKNWSSTEHVGETLLAKQLAPETAVTIHSDTSLLRKTVNLESPEGGTFQ